MGLRFASRTAALTALMLAAACAPDLSGAHSYLALLDHAEDTCEEATYEMGRVWRGRAGRVASVRRRFPEDSARELAGVRLRGLAALRLLEELRPEARARAPEGLWPELDALHRIVEAHCTLAARPATSLKVFETTAAHLAGKFGQGRRRVEAELPLSPSERAALLQPLEARLAQEALEAELPSPRTGGPLP